MEGCPQFPVRISDPNPRVMGQLVLLSWKLGEQDCFGPSAPWTDLWGCAEPSAGHRRNRVGGSRAVAADGKLGAQDLPSQAHGETPRHLQGAESGPWGSLLWPSSGEPEKAAGP